MVRNMLYPETLQALRANRSAKAPFKLFELDQVVEMNPKTDTGTETKYKLCLLLCHARASFDEMKGNVEALARFMGKEAHFSPAVLSGFIDGRSAQVKLGNFSGFLGEMHPSVLHTLGAELPLVVFECYLA